MTPDEIPDENPEVTQVDAPAETNEEVTTPAQAEVTGSELSETVETLQNEEEEEDPYDVMSQDVPQVDFPTLDLSQLPQDENGGIDANALVDNINKSLQAAVQAAEARAEAKFNEQRTEQKLWDKAFDKYPELKKDKSLRDTVQALRFGQALQTGKILSPAQAAEKLVRREINAKVEGIKAATETVKVQASAHVETSNIPTDQKATKTQELFGKIGSRNPHEADAAQRELIKSLFFAD